MRRVCAHGVFGLQFSLLSSRTHAFVYGLRISLDSFRVLVAAVQPCCGRIFFVLGLFSLFFLASGDGSPLSSQPRASFVNFGCL